MNAKYKGITFEANYSRTFEHFKSEFENTWVFKGIQEKERLAELKKAFKIATKKTAEIKVNQAQ
jgi:hypothetical protein